MRSRTTNRQLQKLNLYSNYRLKSLLSGLEMVKREGESTHTRAGFGWYLPHVGVDGLEFMLYDECMTQVYIADAILFERKALRLLLLDMDMKIAGEAGDWSTTLANLPNCSPDMLVIDSEILPHDSHAALGELRRACPNKLTIVLIGRLEARQQAALMVGADMFISKNETPDRVSKYLRAAVGVGGW